MNITKRRVKCHPYVQKLRNFAAQSQAWTVPVLCEAYKWPSRTLSQFINPVAGKIGIVELGGGWSASDMAAYFKSIGQPVPTITDVSVDGIVNSKQSPQNDADYEVALDIQVSGAAFFVATGIAANIRVYWSQNIDTAVAKAAADGCVTCSISWGADEASWGNTQAQLMETTAHNATLKGMTIFAAAGDNDSSDGGPTAANVDCPGSCPAVISCGGTTKTSTSEAVWNNNPGNDDGEGTGGGYSTIFYRQNWQIGAPKYTGSGRIVPDVAANADPQTGYEILVYGASTVVGGTSAVAPLYAGLFAAFGKRLGFVSPTLWKNQQCFNDITVGSNGKYSAAVGPDPCSGIGSPIGTAIAQLLIG